MKIELTPLCLLYNCPNWKQCAKNINIARESQGWWNCINLLYFHNNCEK